MALNTENIFLIVWGMLKPLSAWPLKKTHHSNAVAFCIHNAISKEKKRQCEVLLNFYLGCLPLLVEVHVCLAVIGLALSGRGLGSGGKR